MVMLTQDHDRTTNTMPIPMSSDEIAADLIARIDHGEYPPGTRLPSYGDLAELYTISTTTAYRIYADLRKRGVVVGSRGRGMYAAERPPAK